MTKDELFAILDEWAISRGVIDGGIPGAEIVLGVEYDGHAAVAKYPMDDAPGKRVAHLLKTLPTRLLFEHPENTDLEKRLLEFNRKHVESNPRWMSLRMAGAVMVGRCLGINGTERQDVLCYPSVNGHVPTPDEARREADRWVLNQLHLAYMKDTDPLGSHDF